MLRLDAADLLLALGHNGPEINHHLDREPVSSDEASSGWSGLPPSFRPADCGMSLCVFASLRELPSSRSRLATSDPGSTAR